MIEHTGNKKTLPRDRKTGRMCETVRYGEAAESEIAGVAPQAHDGAKVKAHECR